MKEKLKQFDPSRLFTYAANNGNSYKGINEIVPVRGFNYMNITETTGNPVKIKINPDRPAIYSDGEDICMVNITVVDEKVREVPDASDLITFTLKGSGRIIGVGNGDPSSHEADKCEEGNWKRHFFNGKCQVIVQTSEQIGQISLDAASEGIQQAHLVINSNRVPCLKDN
jgi:beta-galactosidase